MPLSTDFLSNPRTFCQNWVIKMPGGQHEGAGLQNANATFLPEYQAKQAGHKYHVGYSLPAATVQVCWNEYEDGQLELVVQNSGYHGAMNNPLGDWFSAYVLPWGAGKVARMELPDQTGVAGPNKVKAFFTAEMNGCAFLAAGNPSSPVVSHLNVDAQTPFTPVQKDAELDRMVTSALKLTRGGPAIGGETGAVLHWKQPVNAAAPTVGAQLARTGSRYADQGAETAGFDNSVTASVGAANRKFHNGIPPVSDIKVSTMGVMDPASNQWQFFYQRNFYTSYTTIKKIGNLGPIKNIFGDWRAPRHHRYYERMPGYECVLIWPVGAGVVNIPAHGDPTQP
jgi:hypothetical protein